MGWHLSQISAWLNTPAPLPAPEPEAEQARGEREPDEESENLIRDGGSSEPVTSSSVRPAGNYLGIKSERGTLAEQAETPRQRTVRAAKHGAVTWGAFLVAGMMP